MVKLLDGKCAVVTGGGRGQGREIALAMARQGVKLIVNDFGGAVDGSGSDRAPADDVVAEIKKEGGTAIANHDTVADFTAAENIITACVENYGRIDILVNCAGIGGRRPGKFWETSKEDWDTVIATNLNGTFYTCRHALAHMVKQGTGRIINFSSPAWLGMGASAYTASKGAVVSLSTGIAHLMTFEGYGITCNSIIPIADTRMSPRRGGEIWERFYKAGLITRQIYEESSDPPGPEHIPAVVLYLATDEAAKVNGQVIGASRGRVALYSWPTEVKGLYKEGVWTLEELMKSMPATLLQGLQTARG
ncbi:MAG: SDR family NAD(P)-dependent oxidoreductase [Dehalococcoidales bacterium]